MAAPRKSLSTRTSTADLAQYMPPSNTSALNSSLKSNSSLNLANKDKMKRASTVSSFGALTMAPTTATTTTTSSSSSSSSSTNIPSIATRKPEVRGYTELKKSEERLQSEVEQLQQKLLECEETIKQGNLQRQTELIAVKSQLKQKNDFLNIIDGKLNQKEEQIQKILQEHQKELKQATENNRKMMEELSRSYEEKQKEYLNEIETLSNKYNVAMRVLETCGYDAIKMEQFQQNQASQSNEINARFEDLKEMNIKAKQQEQMLDAKLNDLKLLYARLVQ